MWTVLLACHEPEEPLDPADPTSTEEGCAEDTDCDDGDACTVDSCAQGDCASAPLLCEAPPDVACLDEHTLRSWAEAGTCGSAGCEYEPIDTLCEDACEGAACVSVPEGQMQWLVTVTSEDMVDTPSLSAMPGGDLAATAYSWDTMDFGGTVVGTEPGGTALARLAPDGTVLWARMIHGDDPRSSSMDASAITWGPDDGFYLSVVGNGTIRVAPDSPEEVSLEGDPENFYGVIARLDADGSPVWTRHLSAEAGAAVLTMATLADGRLAVTGYHCGRMVLGEGEPGEVTMEGGPYDFRTWLAVFSAEGELQWAWDGPNGYRATVGVSADHVFVTGTHLEPFPLEGGEVMEIVDSSNIYLLAFTLEGELDWSDQISGGYVAGYALGVSPDGSVAVGGFFEDRDLTLSTGTDQQGSLPLRGWRDSWLAVWGADGTRLWEREGSVGPQGMAEVTGIAADDDGGWQIVGYVEADLQLQDGSGGYVNLGEMVAGLDGDIFYVRYDALGVPQAGNMAGSYHYDSGVGAVWGSSGPVLSATFTEQGMFGRGDPTETIVNLQGYRATAFFALTP